MLNCITNARCCNHESEDATSSALLAGSVLDTFFLSKIKELKSKRRFTYEYKVIKAYKTNLSVHNRTGINAEGRYIEDKCTG